MSTKNKTLLQFVSNCKTESKREEYVKELEKFMNISIFGKCRNQKCDKACEKDHIGKDNLFMAQELGCLLTFSFR